MTVLEEIDQKIKEVEADRDKFRESIKGKEVKFNQRINLLNLMRKEFETKKREE